jgi:hypothetical protein
MMRRGLLLVAVPASAREDETITILCEPSGFTFEADAHSLFGQSTADAHFIVVDPFGDTCRAIE